MEKARYYRKDNGNVLCQLCPHMCTVRHGERGKCGVRKNIDGELYSMAYGKPVSVSLDPIEKKPLFHFMPGEKAYSIGTAGCNMSCKFCQNWEISQKTEEDLVSMDMPPERVVEDAQRRRAGIIAYTYNEPSVYMEYMQDTAKIAQEKGMKNVEVTCGMVNEEPLKDLIPYLDAANVDLKYFSDELYREVSGGYLEPVLRTIKTLKDAGIWIEITNLVIPGLNDGEEMIQEMCEWIVEELGPNVPLHLSRFYPTYKMTDRGPTPIETLKKAEDIAREEGINHVYVGNVLEEASTKCSECENVLIERKGFSSEVKGMEKGKCSNCGREVPGVWR